MSKCQSQLRHFLKSLDSQLLFPRESIINFLSTTPLNVAQFQKLYTEFWQYYLIDLQHCRQIAMLLFIGIWKNIEGMIDNAVDFLQGLICSRLVMLIFNEKGQLEIDRILLYLEPTVQLTVIKGLDNGKDTSFLNMIEQVNSREHKFNEIGFLLEMGFIRKIQKYLEYQSLDSFNQILKGLLSSKKLNRLSNYQNAIHFRHIAILRLEEDKQDTYYLQFVNGSKLLKMKDSFAMNTLPSWVQQAFWKMPKNLNLLDFKANSVSKVFSLLSEVEVFASSPLIQEFDFYTHDEIFLAIFQQFLMGLNITNEPYQFRWEKMKQSLQLIRKNSLHQNYCYMGILVEQMAKTLENLQKITNDKQNGRFN